MYDVLYCILGNTGRLAQGLEGGRSGRGRGVVGLVGGLFRGVREQLRPQTLGSERERGLGFKFRNYHTEY